MNYLTKALYHWLAASGQTGHSGPHVISCSESRITLGETGTDNKLTSGQIFLHVGHDLQTLCREECGVLFREILSDQGDGTYTTKPATFAQVFPPETYDITLADLSIESILPACSELDSSLAVGRRGLQDAPATAPAAEPSDIARKHDDDDDYHYPDDKSKDNHYPSYEDDHYYSEDKESGFRKFLDATKKFVFDMYCIIRGLDCDEYHPGSDDHTDDYYHPDDDYPSKDHYDDDDWRRSNNWRNLDVSAPARNKQQKRLKGATRKQRRTLKEEEDTATEETPTDAPSQDTGSVVAEIASDIISTTTTINLDYDPESDQSNIDPSDFSEYGKDDSKGGSGGGGGGGDKDSGSKEDDDHPYDDDDFFDDDHYDEDDGGNFFKILDTIATYVENIYCIFARCKDDYEKPKYDDDYSSKDKDKHRQLLAVFESPMEQRQQPNWMTSLFSDNNEDMHQVPVSIEEWLSLNKAGECLFTGCSNVHSPTQCFDGSHITGKTCRSYLNDWFSVPAPGEDNVLSWELDSACYGQDYCYASNVFEQTLCDSQFYNRLMQACPVSGSSSLILSNGSPLKTFDLYEQCSLVSILLYARLQQQSEDIYQFAQRNQKVFESNECH